MPKFCRSFFFGLRQKIWEQHSTIHDIESPRIRLRCSAPSQDHLVHNLAIRQSFVCPNGLPVVGDVVYTEPPVEDVIAVAMLAERTAARAVHVYAPNFPVSSKGAEDQRK